MKARRRTPPVPDHAVPGGRGLQVLTLVSVGLAVVALFGMRPLGGAALLMPLVVRWISEQISGNEQLKVFRCNCLRTGEEGPL